MSRYVRVNHNVAPASVCAQSNRERLKHHHSALFILKHCNEPSWRGKTTCQAVVSHRAQQQVCTSVTRSRWATGQQTFHTDIKGQVQRGALVELYFVRFGVESAAAVCPSRHGSVKNHEYNEHPVQNCYKNNMPLISEASVISSRPSTVVFTKMPPILMALVSAFQAADSQQHNSAKHETDVSVSRRLSFQHLLLDCYHVLCLVYSLKPVGIYLNIVFDITRVWCG